MFPDLLHDHIPFLHVIVAIVLCSLACVAIGYGAGIHSRRDESFRTGYVAGRVSAQPIDYRPPATAGPLTIRRASRAAPRSVEAMPRADPIGE